MSDISELLDQAHLALSEVGFGQSANGGSALVVRIDNRTAPVNLISDRVDNDSDGISTQLDRIVEVSLLASDLEYQKPWPDQVITIGADSAKVISADTPDTLSTWTVRMKILSRSNAGRSPVRRSLR